jgi:hypothetical protein
MATAAAILLTFVYLIVAIRRCAYASAISAAPSSVNVDPESGTAAPVTVPCRVVVPIAAPPPTPVTGSAIV